MRILFMGTPDIAAECLKALYSAGHDICAVYTRRDKPVGRKQVLTAPPVKEVALEHGTPVFQPRTLRDGSEDANIRALAPELIVVVAYGQILPVEVLEEVLKLGAAYAREHGERESVSGKDETISADLVGFNMEGPFISHKKKGAQNEKYIIPCDEEVFRRFYTASEGLLKFVGLAPEENPGFADFIRAVKGMAKVSLAHTNADYDTAMRAFHAGASHVVHLYDAMTPFTHREPGILGAAADSEGVTAELICDGIHVHPAAVRMAFKLLGKERIVFISDSLRCTGMPDGIYKLGGQSTQKDGKYCRLCDSGNIAGSVSNLYDCMKNAVQTMDIPLEDAIYCATASPAKCLGIYDRYGSIENGKVGDLLLIDKKDLSLKAVFKRGRCVSDFT